MKISGSATLAGTERYRGRFAGRIPPEHFRRSQELWMSSIGIGTYLGDHDDATDELYRRAVTDAVASGCNVIDTAINYRCQRSERAIGAALEDLRAQGYGRDELIVASKAGFLPFDGIPPQDPRRYFQENFIQTGLVTATDIVGGYHCMAPRYLTHQLDRSRANLGVECIDIFYLHNPESQLGKIEPREFDSRLLKAFEALEQAVADEKIRLYGTATWNGYRNAPDAKDYLSLGRIVALAEQVGGERHHLKAVQLPLNLAMSEALASANQPLGDKKVTLLEAAQALGITVMCSASVLQAQLTRNLPEMVRDAFPELETDGQRALQFVRSTPGVTAALVGMKRPEHVAENMRTALVPPAPWAQYAKLFEST